VALIRHAYVPGAREVMERLISGRCRIRPLLLAKLRSALAEASTQWGQAAQEGFFSWRAPNLRSSWKGRGSWCWG